MGLRYSFIDELSEEVRESLQYKGKLNTSNPLLELPLKISTLSLDGSEFLPVVEVQNKPSKYIAKIRVIIKTKTNGTRGVNVLVPYAFSRQETSLKIQDLRFAVRNQPSVAVSFKNLVIRSGFSSCSLYLFADDFRVRRPEEESEVDSTLPKIEI